MQLGCTVNRELLMETVSSFIEQGVVRARFRTVTWTEQPGQVPLVYRQLRIEAFDQGQLLPVGSLYPVEAMIQLETDSAFVAGAFSLLLESFSDHLKEVPAWIPSLVLAMVDANVVLAFGRPGVLPNASSLRADVCGLRAE